MKEFPLIMILFSRGLDNIDNYSTLKKMKQITLIFILILFLGKVHGQRDTGTVYKNLETRKSYAVNLISRNGEGKIIYEVNGKKVSKQVYDKYHSTWKNMVTCCPCILKSYDENDILLRESVSCADCEVGWFKDYFPNGNLKLKGNYKENPTGNWKNIWDRGYCNVPDGEWIYFNENGETLYSEFWDNGVFIKQFPEQSFAEIWDVELILNGKKIDTQKIALSKIKDLVIKPKYKNHNTNTKLTIKFEVSALNHKINEKQFTIESFKNIDVASMLSEVGIPKEKITFFMLSVYNNGIGLKGFYLNVIK